MVFVGFALTLGKFGIGAALIQRPKVTSSHISTAFWTNLAIGCGLLVGAYLLGPFIADFYGEPLVGLLVRVLGVLFLVGAVGIVPRALLQRRMKFDAIAKVELASAILSGALAIGSALSGWGVWSLVVQQVCKKAGDSVGFWIFATQYPRLHFSMSSVRDLFGFSIGHAGFNMINYWARKSDDLLIGRFIGSYGLGVYDRAYRLMLFPITQIIGMISRVMFPALSSIQHERERVKHIYLRTIGVLALIIFPLMMGLYVVADSFVVVLFGEQWAEVAPIVEILCFVAIFHTVTNPVGWIYNSQGRTDRMFWWGVFGSGTLILAIVIGVSFGSVRSVAIAYLTANIILVYPCVKMAGVLIDMTFSEVARSVSGSLGCAFGMMLVVWGAAMIVPDYWGDMQRLTLLAVLGGVSYFAFVFTFEPAAYHDVRNLVEEQWSKKVGAGP
jgi:PST family polysaccharide transporter